MSAPAVSSSSSSSVDGSKKRKTPVEEAQEAFLAQIFSPEHSTVIKQAREVLGPAPPSKKQKKETSQVEGVKSGIAAAAEEAFNPFVAAMDNYAKTVRDSTPAYTANGAKSHLTSKSAVLDLFYHMARGYTQESVNKAMPAAWEEDPELLLQVLVHARDCQGDGKGERLIVYYALLWLRRNKPRTYLANLTTFLAHGYFKDIVNLVEMIDGREIVQTQPKGKMHSKKMKQPKAKASSSPYNLAPSMRSPLGPSSLELNLLAEYLKADWIKLKAWRNAKKAYAAQEKAEKEKEAAAAKEKEAAAAVPSPTAWFDNEEDVLEPGELGADDEEWIVTEGSNQVEKISLKEGEQASSSSSSSSSSVAAAASESKAQDSKPADHCFISLAAKWAPSENHQYGSQAKRLAKILFAVGEGAKENFAKASYRQLCMKKYRQMLSTLRSHICITEKLCCQNRWSAIKFEMVPSKAHLLLKKAFMKHEPERYQKYLESLKKGETKIKSKGIQPHELAHYYYEGGALDDTVEEQWKAIVAETRAAGSFQSAVAVVDVSGSMSGTPMKVAISMGLLVSTLTEGPYHGRVLTFDSNPAWFQVQGTTLRDQVTSLKDAPWGGSTNLQKTFDLILDVAIKHKVKQDQLPKTLFIFSDMQFDAAVGSNWMSTNYEAIKQKWSTHGYAVPQIIFWNVNGHLAANDVPIQADTPGCALMAGFSSTLLKVFMKGEVLNAVGEEGALNPVNIMKDSIGGYQVIVDEAER